jgi:hypothetical protein
MKHPGHTYGGFIPAISERGMTVYYLNSIVLENLLVVLCLADRTSVEVEW